MKITSNQLRQIIREELSLLTEAPSILSGYSSPVVTADKKNITITATDGRKGTTTNVGLKIIFDSSLVPNMTLPITNLEMLSWTPEVPDGQPFMKMRFVVRGETKEQGLKNKAALKKIADGVLAGTKNVQGEVVRVNDDFSAALIVNYK